MINQRERDRVAKRPALLLNDGRSAAKVQALIFFKQYPRGTVGALATLLCYSKRNTERIVAELKEEGLLSRQGSNRSGLWVVELDR